MVLWGSLYKEPHSSGNIYFLSIKLGSELFKKDKLKTTGFKQAFEIFRRTGRND